MTSDQHRRQIERVLAESERPADAVAESPAQPDIMPDRRRNLRSPNFSRMRTSWSAQDRIVIEEVKVQAEKVMRAMFAEAYSVIDRLYLQVREPLTDAAGMLRAGPDGRPRWRTHNNGLPVENWAVLGDADREAYMSEITTHLFGWQQAAADLWGEAMFAKVQWEEAFAGGFTSPQGKLTVDDRVQHGVKFSIEERYFAVFQALLSRKADALIRVMERLEQRLKDTIQF